MQKKVLYKELDYLNSFAYSRDFLNKAVEITMEEVNTSSNPVLFDYMGRTITYGIPSQKVNFIREPLYMILDHLFFIKPKTNLMLCDCDNTEWILSSKNYYIFFCKAEFKQIFKVRRTCWST